MSKTLDAVPDADGGVRLLEPSGVIGPRRVFVVVLDEPPHLISETTALSEAALAQDWLIPEEDAAWQHLQPGKSS